MAKSKRVEFKTTVNHPPWRFLPSQGSQAADCHHDGRPDTYEGTQYRCHGREVPRGRHFRISVRLSCWESSDGTSLSISNILGRARRPADVHGRTLRNTIRLLSMAKLTKTQHGITPSPPVRQRPSKLHRILERCGCTPKGRSRVAPYGPLVRQRYDQPRYAISSITSFLPLNSTVSPARAPSIAS